MIFVNKRIRWRQGGRVQPGVLLGIALLVGALLGAFIHNPLGIHKAPDEYFTWQVMVTHERSEYGGVILK